MSARLRIVLIPIISILIFSLFSEASATVISNSETIPNQVVYECVGAKTQYTFSVCPPGVKKKRAGVYLGSQVWSSQLDGRSAEYGLFYTGLSKTHGSYLLNFMVQKISGDFEVGNTDSGFRVALVGRDTYKEAMVLGADPIERSFGGSNNQQNNTKPFAQSFPLAAYLPDTFPMRDGILRYEELARGIYVLVRYQPVNRKNGSGSESTTGFVYFLEGDKFPSQLIDGGIQSQKMNSFLNRAIVDKKKVKKLRNIVSVLYSTNQMNPNKNCNFVVGGKCMDSNPEPFTPPPGAGCNFMVGGVCRG